MPSLHSAFHSTLSPRHHLTSHEKGAIIALSAVFGVFAIIIGLLLHFWRSQQTKRKAEEVDLEGLGKGSVN
jgi:RsiW-degrading membrane proteinase PrsW (M82 family)